MKKILKKAQTGITVKPTADSTKYYKDLYNANVGLGSSQNTVAGKMRYIKGATEAQKNIDRQKLKGKPGYDANGFPLKKKMGGSTKAKKK